MTIRYVKAEMTKILRGEELIVPGDLNFYLEGMDIKRRDEEIAVAITMAGIVDLAGNFLLRRRTWCKDWLMWAMVSPVRSVRSRTA